MARLVEAFGEPIQTPISGLTRLTPTPEKIVQCPPEALTALGILASRSQTIRAIAQAVISENLQLHNYADIRPTVIALRKIPGVGDWTAQYIAMRVLADPDAFPAGDLVLRRSLGVDKASQALRIAEAWRPWRAYAAIYLWKSLAERAK